jgi:hypothetical protein
VSESDDVDSKGDKVVRRSVGSLLSRTGYAIASKAPIEIPFLTSEGHRR